MGADVTHPTCNIQCKNAYTTELKHQLHVFIITALINLAFSQCLKPRDKTALLKSYCNETETYHRNKTNWLLYGLICEKNNVPLKSKAHVKYERKLTQWLFLLTRRCAWDRRFWIEMTALPSQHQRVDGPGGRSRRHNLPEEGCFPLEQPGIWKAQLLFFCRYQFSSKNERREQKSLVQKILGTKRAQQLSFKAKRTLLIHSTYIHTSHASQRILKVCFRTTRTIHLVTIQFHHLLGSFRFAIQRE